MYLAAAQVAARENSIGEVEFLATTLYLLNESYGGSLQLRDNSNASRMGKYNGMLGEVYHEAGQYGAEGDSSDSVQRFHVLAKRDLSSLQVSAALALFQPTLLVVLQNNAGLTNVVCGVVWMFRCVTYLSC